MHRLLLKAFLGFILIALCVAVTTRYFDFEFGNDNFWDHHGILFLVGVSLFPRLTMLFSGVATGSIFWWLSWLFFPRVLVATLATLAYWNQNPVLVLISWLVALGGESSEKTVIVRRGTFSRRGHHGRRNVDSDDIETTAKKVD